MRNVVTLLAVLFLLTTAVAAQQTHDVVVLVTLEGVSLDQLSRWGTPAINMLVREGATGLMNNKTDGTTAFDDNAVTIGAGTHARGTDGLPSAGISVSWNGFNANEHVDGDAAGALLKRYTGTTPPATAVVQTGIAHINNLNSAQRYVVIPGLLGDQLQRAGVTARVYGNTDAGEQRLRNGVSIAMNHDGWVPSGDVGRHTVVNAPDRPFGISTNYEYLYHQITALPSGKQFVVVEAGDGGRVEMAKSSLSPTRYLAMKQQSTAECARFVQRVQGYLAHTYDRYLLIFAVVSPNSDSAEQGDLLTPVVMTGSGVASGLLYSPTTRRNGLITNTDLAPSVLHFFRVVPHDSMLGYPVSGVSAPHPLATLHAMNTEMVQTYQARIPVLTGFIIMVALSGILALIGVMLSSRPAGAAQVKFNFRYIMPVLTALMLVPAALMFSAGVGIHTAAPTALFLIGTTLSVAILLHRFVRKLSVIFAIVGLFTSATICLDLVTGAFLLKQSILSYDPITGIRFYGLGNESSGVLLGATILGLYALLDSLAAYRDKLLIVVGVVYAAVFVVIGSPNYGTDFGGMLSALPAFGIAFWKVRDDRRWRRMFVIFSVLALLLLGGLMAVNLHGSSGAQTHIGRAFNDAFQHGPSVLVDLAIRKWSMNLRLIRSSIWTYALLSLLFSLLVLLYRPVGIVQSTLRKHPLLNAGLLGIIVALVVAMLTNDSGVAMAATGILYLAVPLILMVIAEVDSLQTTPRLTQPLSELRVE